MRAGLIASILAMLFLCGCGGPPENAVYGAALAVIRDRPDIFGDIRIDAGYADLFTGKNAACLRFECHMPGSEDPGQPGECLIWFRRVARTWVYDRHVLQGIQPGDSVSSDPEA